MGQRKGQMAGIVGVGFCGMRENVDVGVYSSVKMMRMIDDEMIDDMHRRGEGKVSAALDNAIPAKKHAVRSLWWRHVGWC